MQYIKMQGANYEYCYKKLIIFICTLCNSLQLLYVIDFNMYSMKELSIEKLK